MDDGGRKSEGKKPAAVPDWRMCLAGVNSKENAIE
jgi:hypothetical protein